MLLLLRYNHVILLCKTFSNTLSITDSNVTGQKLSRADLLLLWPLHMGTIIPLFHESGITSGKNFMLG